MELGRKSRKGPSIEGLPPLEQLHLLCRVSAKARSLEFGWERSFETPPDGDIPRLARPCAADARLEQCPPNLARPACSLSLSLCPLSPQERDEKTVYCQAKRNTVCVLARSGFCCLAQSSSLSMAFTLQACVCARARGICTATCTFTTRYVLNRGSSVVNSLPHRP